MAEMEKIKSAVKDAGVGEAWIGLKNGSSPKWQWSLADRGFYRENETEFRNWDGGNPNPAGGEDCVAIKDRDGKKWHDYICTTNFHFICYNGTNSTHVLVEDKKNWTDAQRYCRENHTDLASVRNQTENTQIQNTINQTPNTTDNYVWIGLFRDAWEWSDGSSSSFRHWGPGEPNYGSSNQHEFCAEMKPSGLWNGVQCNSKRKCICYEGKSLGPFHHTHTHTHTHTAHTHSTHTHIKCICYEGKSLGPFHHTHTHTHTHTYTAHTHTHTHGTHTQHTHTHSTGR
ncbi:hypothetical protein ACEWY4_024634 [Coilia grayii]|uniref:C-type lectin domain-containing protein n=1 Tax=Coilia grayii TaxID=363190 RepID=A0ABD1IV89_9TELE